MPRNHFNNELQFMNGGGESGSLIRALDWKKTSLGDPLNWPECICTAISICLNSTFPNAVYCGPEFNLIYNDAYRQIAGDNHPEIMGKPRHEAWPESWMQTRVLFEEVISTQTAVNAVDELFLVKRFGFIGQGYFSYTLSPIFDAGGKIWGIFNSLMETTDRVLAERRAGLLMLFKTRSAQFLTLDTAFKEVLLPLKNERRDILSAELYAIADHHKPILKHSLDPIDWEEGSLEPVLAEVLSIGQPVFLEQRNQRLFLIPVKQGENDMVNVLVTMLNKQIYFDDTYRQFLENIGFLIGTTLAYASGLERDRMVSDRIKYNEDQLQFAVDAAELATWDFNTLTRSFSGNSRWYNWFGIPEGTAVSLHQTLNRIAEGDRTRMLQGLNKALDENEDGYYRVEYHLINPEHPVPRLVKTTGRVIFNSNKEVIRFSGTLQDITAERNTLLILEETNNRLEIALEAGRLGSYELEPQTGKMVCTAQFLANLGRPANISFTYEDLFAQVLPDYHQLLNDTVRSAIQENHNYEVEYEVRWPDGSFHWIEAYGKPQYDEDGKIKKIIGVIQDVTAQIIGRKELERAYEQARLSREAAQFGTFDHDLINRTMEWDERCRLMFGITHQRPLNMERDLIGGIHEEDRPHVKELLKYALDRELSNGNYDVEYRTIGAEDGIIRWVRAKGKVFFNEYGIPLRFIGAVLEITAQKENEIRKNDFISMVSHELKTPLTSLKAHVQILNRKAKGKNDSYSAAALDKVEIQIKKMSTMIHGFLSLDRLASGQIHLDKSEFVLNELIRTQIDETALLASHTLHFEACPEINIYADYEKLGQVLTNLISNAIKYSPQGGQILIQCRMDGGHAVVSIQDQGIGIGEADIIHLFDRFYRVEGKYTKLISGFGIGLYLSAEIIRRHQGKIWVKSEKGNGSTFYFSIPQMIAPAP